MRVFVGSSDWMDFPAIPPLRVTIEAGADLLVTIRTVEEARLLRRGETFTTPGKCLLRIRAVQGESEALIVPAAEPDDETKLLEPDRAKERRGEAWE